MLWVLCIAAVGGLRSCPPPPPQMLFLAECPLKPNAFEWAKESRLRSDTKAVVALYDAREDPVYVGFFEDAAFSVAALVKKHGAETVAAVRFEEFPELDDDEEVGKRLMRNLAKAWLAEASAEVGGKTPIGNATPDWDDVDPDSNPFLFGLIGEGELQEGERGAAALGDEERLQRRRDQLKQKLDDAIAAGDEGRANEFLRRLTALGEEDASRR